MKSKKILIIIPIILIVLLVAVAGVGATLYFATDLFKSPKQLFFKYLGSSISSDNFDYDKTLAELNKQYELTSKSEGKITIDLEADELVENLSKNKRTKDYADIVKNIKKAEIKYTAESVPTQSKSRFSLTPVYDNKDITNIQLVENGDNYGLKCDDLYNKYIYIENNELTKLLERFDIKNTPIPDKIQKVNYYELLNISEKSRKELKDKYLKFFDKKLTNDMFSVNKKVSTSVNDSQVEATAYNFTINEVQAYDIMTSFFETLKNDEATLNLIVERLYAAGITSTKMIDTSSYDDDITSSSIISKTNYKTVDVNKDFIIELIDNCIDELNDEKSSADSSNTITFTMYIRNKKLVKFEAKNLDDTSVSVEITTNVDERTISIFDDNEKVLKTVFTLTTNNNSTNLNGSAEIYEYNEIASKVEYTISYSDNYSKIYFKTIPDVESDDETIEMNIESKGKVGEENVQTSGYIKLDIEDVNATINFEQTTKYPNDINIDELNSKNGLCLNSAGNSEIKNAFSEITKNFVSVLPEKAKILGININSNNNNNNNSNIINEKELTDYTEADISGVKFKYPSSWKSNNSSTTPGFINSTNGTNVNLISESSRNYDLEDYIDLSITNLKTAYAEKLNGDINKTAVKLNNRDCYILDYKISQSNITANIKQVIFIDDGTAYVLTSTMRESSVSTDTEIINNIISTLKK